ncbi:MAG TPA: DNA polymerase III subunit gamma/tau, partial [Rubrivivax sp.]|nr:DNA polymerase III subunit gamma/tau [Rubrivivax sp.]
IERAAYKPSTGRFKVFMIDEAHQLTKDAFNALLKTLEEPPEYLKFVLATTDPEKMLPTVLSRCLQFNLRPMAPATVRDHLQQVLQAEGVAHDEASLRLLARAARGSMRDGLSLTDQAIAYGGGKLTEDTVRDMLGSVDRGHVRALLEALAGRNGAALLAAVDGLRSLGLSAAGTLEEMALVLQQMAVDQAVPGALDAQDPETEDARALSSLLAADETQLLYSMALHGREELTLMSDEYGALTMVLLRFLAFPPTSSAQAGRAEAPKARPLAAAPLRASPPPRITLPAAVSKPAAAPPAPQPAAPVPPVAATLPADPVANALGDRWHAAAKLLLSRGLVSGLAETLAMHSGLQQVDDSTVPPRWTLRVEREMLRTPALRDKLQSALAQALDQAVNIELEAGVPDDSPHKRDTAERARRQAAAVAAIETDPVVRDLLSQYATARIVPGSIKPVESKES